MSDTRNQDGKGMSRRKFIGNAAALSAFFIVPRHVLGGIGYIAPSDMVTLGFIGAGRQAHSLQRSFLSLPDARILAACDVYASKVENFTKLTNKHYAEKGGQANAKGCQSYHHFMDLLNREDIDAVVISTPDHWHGAMAVRAAAAGKDIYNEKPLSLTVREGRAMVDAVKKHKRVFQTGSMQRSSPEFRHAVELIRNGYLGDLQTVKVSIGGPPVPYDLPKETVPEGLDWNLWLGPNADLHYNYQLNPTLGDKLWARWRYYKGLGGGDMTDWGAHMFDIVQWALDMDNSGPSELLPPNGSDIKHLTFKYPHGVIMTHEDFGKKHAIQFNGSEGRIEIQRGSLVTDPVSLKDVVIKEGQLRVYKSTNHHADFINAVKKRTETVTPAETGHRSGSVGNLANIALEINKPLVWDPQQEIFTNNDEANKLLSRELRKEWSI